MHATPAPSSSPSVVPGTEMNGFRLQYQPYRAATGSGALSPAGVVRGTDSFDGEESGEEPPEAEGLDDTPLDDRGAESQDSLLDFDPYEPFEPGA